MNTWPGEDPLRVTVGMGGDQKGFQEEEALDTRREYPRGASRGKRLPIRGLAGCRSRGGTERCEWREAKGESGELEGAWGKLPRARSADFIPAAVGKP